MKIRLIPNEIEKFQNFGFVVEQDQIEEETYNVQEKTR
jgi:hypothetical protein